MEITIRPTRVRTLVGGSDCRIWEGVLPSGLRVQVYVPLIAASVEDFELLTLELQMKLPPLNVMVPINMCLWV